jgi:hypothetical protein
MTEFKIPAHSSLRGARAHTHTHARTHTAINSRTSRIQFTFWSKFMKSITRPYERNNVPRTACTMAGARLKQLSDCCHSGGITQEFGPALRIEITGSWRLHYCPGATDPLTKQTSTPPNTEVWHIRVTELNRICQQNVKTFYSLHKTRPRRQIAILKRITFLHASSPHSDHAIYSSLEGRHTVTQRVTWATFNFVYQDPEVTLSRTQHFQPPTVAFVT